MIDTHTHFYDPTRPQGVPWPPANDALLYRKIMPADFRALPLRLPVRGTVVVEASPWVEDNQWILDLAARNSFIMGFVGNLPLGTADFPRLLARFAANPVFRGIRINGRRLSNGFDQVLPDLRLLARHGLFLDVVGAPDLLPLVDRLADALPDLRVVIDHVAGVRVDGKAPPNDWAEGIRRVAKHSNAWCKVSGLVEGTGRTDGGAPREAEFYQPVLDVLWEAFGPERLVYGSNWPVSERFAPCAIVQGLVADYFGQKGRAALSNVFQGNAKLAYQLAG